MPVLIIQLLQLLPLLISAAKDAQPIIDAAKQVISDFAHNGQISVAQQNKLHSHCDALMQAALSGAKPPEFEVEPDPQNAA